MVGISTVIESGKIYRLKATKRKMYKLAGKYAHVDVKQKETGFTKTGNGGYFLDFWQDGKRHHFFLAAIGGAPMLGHSVTRWVGNQELEDWYTHRLSLDTLKKLGMSEEVQTKERRMSNVG